VSNQHRVCYQLLFITGIAMSLMHAAMQLHDHVVDGEMVVSCSTILAANKLRLCFFVVIAATVVVS
jgi:hypothetical protein